MSFFVITGSGFESGRTLYETGNFYYPPVYGYLLSALTYFWNFFPLQPGEISDLMVSSIAVSDFSNLYISSIALTLVYKIPLIIIDFVCSWLIYSMVMEKTGDKKKAEIGFALFFLSPLVIWSSSVACMFDSFSALLMIFSIYSLTKNHYFISGAMLSLAVFTKFFPIVIGFAVVCYIISRSQGRWIDIFKRATVYLAGFLIATIMIFMPLFLNGELSSAFSFFSNRADRADNVLSEGIGLWDFILNPIPDKFLYAFPIIFLLIAIFSTLAFVREGDDDKKLVIASVMSVCILFIWPPIPTYPVIAIALIALAVTYCGKGEWLVPWLSFSVLMVVHHILVFGNRIFFTLANEIPFLDLGKLVSEYFQLLPVLSDIRYYTLLTLFIPGVICIFISVYSLKYKEETEK